VDLLTSGQWGLARWAWSAAEKMLGVQARGEWRRYGHAARGFQTQPIVESDRRRPRTQCMQATCITAQHHCATCIKTPESAEAPLAAGPARTGNAVLTPPPRGRHAANEAARQKLGPAPYVFKGSRGPLSTILARTEYIEPQAHAADAAEGHDRGSPQPSQPRGRRQCPPREPRPRRHAVREQTCAAWRKQDMSERAELLRAARSHDAHALTARCGPAGCVGLRGQRQCSSAPLPQQGSPKVQAGSPNAQAGSSPSHKQVGLTNKQAAPMPKPTALTHEQAAEEGHELVGAVAVRRAEACPPHRRGRVRKRHAEHHVLRCHSQSAQQGMVRLKPGT
jgi:hypothetical protein